MCESTKQSVADMRKRCKDLVGKGDTSVKGYSKLSRTQLSELMAKLDNTSEPVEIEEEAVITKPVAVAKIPVKTILKAVTEVNPISEKPLRKAKRAPSQWNTYCKDNKIAPGSSISQEQKDAYASHKASLAVSA